MSYSLFRKQVLIQAMAKTPEELLTKHSCALLYLIVLVGGFLILGVAYFL